MTLARRQTRARKPSWLRPKESEYKAYTTAFDEVVFADELCDPLELERLRGVLDKHSAELTGHHQQARQSIAAQADGATEPNLGVRPGRGHARHLAPDERHSSTRFIR